MIETAQVEGRDVRAWTLHRLVIDLASFATGKDSSRNDQIPSHVSSRFLRNSKLTRIIRFVAFWFYGAQEIRVPM